jgi:hypothetical protein
VKKAQAQVLLALPAEVTPASTKRGAKFRRGTISRKGKVVRSILLPNNAGTLRRVQVVGDKSVRFFPDPRAERAAKAVGSGLEFVPGGKYQPGKFKGLDELRRKFNLVTDSE